MAKFDKNRSVRDGARSNERLIEWLASPVSNSNEANLGGLIIHQLDARIPLGHRASSRPTGWRGR